MVASIQDASDNPPKSSPARVMHTIKSFAYTNYFVIGVIFAIILAFLYPPLGSQYLAPEITSTYIAVMLIFLLSGITLKTSEFLKALNNYKFNLSVQFFNLLVISSLTHALSRLLLAADIISNDLADGFTIMSCLPMTVNMVIVMTKAAKGDEASAVFNAAAGNLIGVIATPSLVLMYLGRTSSVSFIDVLGKLSVRVLLPLFVGQVIQYKFVHVKEYVSSRKVFFKKVQEFALTFIVYVVFCQRFYEEGDGGDSDGTSGDSVDLGQGILMIFIIGIWVSLLMLLAWFVFSLLQPNEPALRIFAIFGCTHKTIAMGIPIMSAMYGSDPKLASYTLPLLIWHPVQLIIGSACVGWLGRWYDQQVVEEGRGVEMGGVMWEVAVKEEEEEEEERL